jgi:hypothetical protein
MPKIYFICQHESCLSDLNKKRRNIEDIVFMLDSDTQEFNALGLKEFIFNHHNEKGIWLSETEYENWLNKMVIEEL